MKSVPDFSEEAVFWDKGLHLVVGVDEVGRGPLAGPVVASAVILPHNPSFSWLRYVRDSKKLTPIARSNLSASIHHDALGIGISAVPHNVIDAIGIAEATRWAMLLAIRKLPLPPHQLLIDAVALPNLTVPQRSIVHGDAISLSIACASIVAKVFRDQLMIKQAERFGAYGFTKNKGYATREHMAALRRVGPCAIHRRSFAPVKLATASIAAQKAVEV